MSDPAAQWLPPPQTLSIQHDHVHVWRASLDQPPWLVQQLWPTLHPNEQNRAQRFVFPKDRNHYIVARGTLRAILGRYLSIAPQRLYFRYNAYGKPILDEQHLQHTIAFNVSHSHGLALLAFARCEDLGVDIEYMNPAIEGPQIAEHYFSPAEVQKLLSAPPSLQTHAFFNCWTRKEAYIKARGMGISLGLNNFDVSLLPAEPVELLAIRESNQRLSDWSLRELLPGPGYKGALAIKKPSILLHQWQWQPL